MTDKTVRVLMKCCTLKTEYRKSKKISNGSNSKTAASIKKDKTSEAVIGKMTETNKQNKITEKTAKAAISVRPYFL